VKSVQNISGRLGIVLGVYRWDLVLTVIFFMLLNVVLNVNLCCVGVR